MSTKQLIKKKEENMISGSVGGMCFFSLSWPSSLSFYILRNPNSFSTK
jgi:hypothetical protein